ncbi:DUF4268 domain-containing protein [Chloroflexota bacterium]
MSLVFSSFVDEKKQPVTVKLTDHFDDALNKMLDNEFSQLPVVDDNDFPIGIVTYQSISIAMVNEDMEQDEMLVIDVYDDLNKLQKFRIDDEISDMLNRLRDTNAILIVDTNGKLIGIVTTYDSTEYFRARSEDLLDVQDIETTIKEIIRYMFNQPEDEPDNEGLVEAIERVTNTNLVLIEDFAKALDHYIKSVDGGTFKQKAMAQSYTKHFEQKSNVKSFDDLTLYDYVEILLNKNHQDQFENLFGYPPSRIRKLLHNVRKTRNDLVHLKEITPLQRRQLIECKRKLDRIQIGVPVSDWPQSNQEALVKEIREDETSYGVNTEGMAQALLDFAGKIKIISEETDPRESRYTPLADWLQSQPGSRNQVQLSFEKIEEIIGGELPNSAFKHRAWWANDSVTHNHSKLWLEVGWRRSYINMSQKQVTFARIKEREKAYIDFFSNLLPNLREKAPFPVGDFSHGGQSWMVNNKLSVSNAHIGNFGVSFARGNRMRVELYIDTGDRDTNKKIFDLIRIQQANLGENLGKISWERIDDKQASRIALYHPGSITDDAETLSKLQDWAVDNMIAFYNAIEPIASKAASEVLAE